MSNQLLAVLFDVDGVLIDTEKIQSDAFLQVLQQHGHQHTALTEHGTVHNPGETTDTTWERLKARHGITTDLPELTLRKRRATLKALQGALTPMPGVARLMNNLRDHGVQIAVVSSAQHQRLQRVMQGLKLDTLVDVMISANNVQSVKPAPDPYQAALAKLGRSAEECIVIEDALVGIISAKAAGLKVVAVPNQYTNRMDFSQANLQVQSLTDLSYDRLSSLM